MVEAARASSQQALTACPVVVDESIRGCATSKSATADDPSASAHGERGSGDRHTAYDIELTVSPLRNVVWDESPDGAGWRPSAGAVGSVGPRAAHSRFAAVFGRSGGGGGDGRGLGSPIPVHMISVPQRGDVSLGYRGGGLGLHASGAAQQASRVRILRRAVEDRVGSGLSSPRHRSHADPAPSPVPLWFSLAPATSGTASGIRGLHRRGTAGAGACGERRRKRRRCWYQHAGSSPGAIRWDVRRRGPGLRSVNPRGSAANTQGSRWLPPPPTRGPHPGQLRAPDRRSRVPTHTSRGATPGRTSLRESPARPRRRAGARSGSPARRHTRPPRPARGDRRSRRPRPRR